VRGAGKKKKMEKVVINASPRTVIGKKVGVLRREGKLPGVLYGHNFTATPIIMDLRQASKVLHSVTGSSIVTIDLDGIEHAVIVREKQRNFIRGTFLHIDFQVISLTEKIRTNVSIELVGLSPAVKDFNGLIVTGIDELDVECLPQYLPEKITVDISSLLKIGDGIFVRDLQLDSNITIFNHEGEQLVHITAQKTEEEEVVEAVAAVEEPEIIEKGKKEEEVPE
jgi:large subunit ribosomal protein L25